MGSIREKVPAYGYSLIGIERISFDPDTFKRDQLKLGSSIKENNLIL
jgi:hypothetical protein